jgi:outer membrane receptor for ferrienterochelin and colicins
MLLCGLFMVAAITSARGQGRVRLTDAVTGEPVVGATVRFRALGGSDAGSVASRRSDARGIAASPFTSRAAVAVTHVGYVAALDTVEASGELLLRLGPGTISSAPVVVTGQSEPTASDRSIAAVRVIDRAQIESRSALTLRDLLAGDVGTAISNDQILGSSLSIQGLSGQNVKVLVDGVPVVGRIGGAIDLSQIPLANADRVEVIEGPMSVLYGTDALGGVVNIITAKRTRGMLTASAHTSYESVGSYNADARVGAFIGSTRVWVAGGRTLFMGYANPDTSRAKQWKPREQSTVDADITQFIGEQTIGLSASFMDDYILNRGVPRAPYGESAFDDTYHTRRASARLLAQGTMGETPYELSIAYAAYERRRNTFVKDLVTLRSEMVATPGENDTSGAGTLSLRAHLNGRTGIDGLTWDAGGEASVERITGARIDAGEQRLDDYALYGRIEYSPSATISLQPGVRLTYNTRYPAPVIPSLHLKVVPDSALTIRASYGRGFRAPSLQDLHFIFVDINHDIHGNPDLRAETSHNINLGVAYANRSEARSLEADVSGYYNAVRDLITLVGDSGSIYHYQNIGTVNTLGGRLSSTMRGANWMGRVAAGLTGTSNPLAEKGGGGELTVAPELGAEGRWRLIPEVEISADYKYKARVPHYVRGAGGEIVRGLSDDYHLLNASVAWTLPGGFATLRGGVHNIADVTDISLGVVEASTAHGDGSGAVAVAWGRSFILDLQLRMP